MLGGEGAPVGDQQRPWLQETVGEQPVALLADSGRAVGVAVQTLAHQRDGTPFIDDAGDADLNELGVLPLAVRDVRRWHVGGWGRRPGAGERPWLRGLVSSGEAQMCGIEVEAVAWQVGQMESLSSDGGQDGVTLVEEGVKGSSEAVIVEGVGRDVPEEVGSGIGGPGRDVDEGGGLAETGGEQETEDLAVGEGPLWVRGKVSVDDGGDVELLQERCDECQGSEVPGIVGEGGSVPGLCHDASWEDGVAEKQRKPMQCGTGIIGRESSVRA